MALAELALDGGAWSWPRGGFERDTYAGRSCLRFAGEVNGIGAPLGVRLRDGTIELDIAVSTARSFHGLAWRWRDRPQKEVEG